MQHTILLCDDEPYIRNGLKKAIEHELPQFMVRHETDNGADAVQLVQEHLPSVIITDIRMPKMSGIDFLESIQEDAPDLPVIIVSGYPDIEIMRRAMHLGVREFLSKPIDTHLLFAALRKIDVELRVQKTAEARLLEKINTGLSDPIDSQPTSRMQESFLTFQNWFQAQAEDQAKEQHSDHFCYGCVLLTSNCPFKFLQPLIDQFSASDCHLQIAPISHQLYGLFICTHHFDQHQFFMLIQKQLMRIRIFVQRNLSQPVRFFLSDLHSCPQDAFSCCENALITMNTTKFKSQIISNYNDLSSITPAWLTLPSPEIFRDICRPNTSEFLLREAIDRLFESYGPLVREYPDVMHYHIISLFFSACMTENNPALNIHDLLSFVSRLALKNDPEEKKELLMEQVCLIHAVKHQTAQSEPTVSDKVKAYVSSHVQDIDLSINDVAAELFISPNYLRQLFKEQTGQTFVQYLTAHRMVLAKKLLSTGKIRISTAATQLGYQDAKYFSYCFKKYYKITPSEYIQSLQDI